MKIKNFSIDASPTKEFFMEMLIRDIPLSRAILDLVDNSVDSARTLASSADLSDYEINITLDEASFIIKDNCAGIDLKTAENYAFRFGRITDLESAGSRDTGNSIGQFGVGMKRALFKIGEEFEIKSTSKNEYLHMKENVDNWKQYKNAEGVDDWHFKVEDDTSTGMTNQVTGTEIVISELHSPIKEDFTESYFINTLIEEIQIAHSVSLSNKIKIKIHSLTGTKELKPFALNLISSEKIKPAYKKLVFEKDSDNPVTVEIFAGVVPRDLETSGWYIFCNDRTVLQSDKSNDTAWGTDKTVKFHHYFSRFKGFVFFSSDDSSKLPWTTTKTGVDTDSIIYKSTLNEMVNIAKPIISFLKEVGKETIDFNSSKTNGTPLKDAIDKGHKEVISYKNIVSESDVLKIDIERAEENPEYNPETKIQYSRSVEQIAEMIDYIETVNSAKDVGEFTFDYYYDNFIGDNE